MDILRRETVVKYVLRKNMPDMEIVDGPCAGRKYRAAEAYDEVPPGEEAKFERVGTNEEPAMEPPDKGGRKK